MSVKIPGPYTEHKELLVEACNLDKRAEGKALKSVRRDIVQYCPSYAS